MFKNARDGKIVTSTRQVDRGTTAQGFDLVTDEYHHVVLYDHISRRRT